MNEWMNQEDKVRRWCDPLTQAMKGQDKGKLPSLTFKITQTLNWLTDDTQKEKTNKPANKR